MLDDLGELPLMPSLPLIIVVGGDDLALQVCEELAPADRYDVVLLWEAQHDVGSRAVAAGARLCALAPNDYESLLAAGVERAQSIMPVSNDDRLNLQVALKARDINPAIRIVLRQFNRALGRKIAQNLPNCAAISPAAHAAATYAAAAFDPACRYGLQFPELEGPLLGFSERNAGEFGLRAMTVAEAERRLDLRILAVNDRLAQPNDPVSPSDRVSAIGAVEQLQRAWRRGRREKTRGHRRRREWLLDIVSNAARLEPLLFYAFCIGLLLFFVWSVYFMFAMRIGFIEAMYFTAATMFTVGYGDITPYLRHSGVAALIVAIAAMLSGVVIGGIFIATIASALSRAQETALQGMRHIRAVDHVIVCGAGNVGTRVIDFLVRLGKRVVVIEQSPNALVVELARARRIELLRADATSDDTLAFCNLRAAQTLVAVTDSDTANFESALGARVANPTLPVVMRISDPAFARSILNNFTIAGSFSAQELTAPVIAGLAQFPGMRGRVRLGALTFTIAEHRGAGSPEFADIDVFAWRENRLVALRGSAPRAGDRVLSVGVAR